MQAALLHSAMGPLLSPVAEIRTPSPAMGRAADQSKLAPHHKFAQQVHVVNGKHADATPKAQNGNANRSDGGKHQAPTSNPNSSWQQAPARKGHKKSKSNTASKGSHASKTGGGEPLPANEADRKGGWLNAVRNKSGQLDIWPELFCLRQAIATICVIEKSTVSHIWIYFTFWKATKKTNIHEKGHAHHMDCARHRSRKKGGAQEHLHVFLKIPPKRFPCSLSCWFSFSFSFLTILPSRHGVGMGFTTSFCMWALLAEKMHMASRVIAPPMVFLFFAMYRKAAGIQARPQTKRTKMNTKKVEINHWTQDLPTHTADG
jgi:hypothetical protein